MMNTDAPSLSAVLGSHGNPVSRLDGISVEQAAHIERLIAKVPLSLREAIEGLDIASLSDRLDVDGICGREVPFRDFSKALISAGIPLNLLPREELSVLIKSLCKNSKTFIASVPLFLDIYRYWRKLIASKKDVTNGSENAQSDLQGIRSAIEIEINSPTTFAQLSDLLVSYGLDASLTLESLLGRNCTIFKSIEEFIRVSEIFRRYGLLDENGNVDMQFAHQLFRRHSRSGSDERVVRELDVYSGRDLDVSSERLLVRVKDRYPSVEKILLESGKTEKSLIRKEELLYALRQSGVIMSREDSAFIVDLLLLSVSKDNEQGRRSWEDITVADIRRALSPASKEIAYSCFADMTKEGKPHELRKPSAYARRSSMNMMFKDARYEHNAGVKVIGSTVVGPNIARITTQTVSKILPPVPPPPIAPATAAGREKEKAATVMGVILDVTNTHKRVAGRLHGLSDQQIKGIISYLAAKSAAERNTKRSPRGGTYSTTTGDEDDGSSLVTGTGNSSSSSSKALTLLVSRSSVAEALARESIFLSNNDAEELWEALLHTSNIDRVTGVRGKLRKDYLSLCEFVNLMGLGAAYQAFAELQIQIQIDAAAREEVQPPAASSRRNNAGLNRGGHHIPADQPLTQEEGPLQHRNKPGSAWSAIADDENREENENECQSQINEPVTSSSSSSSSSNRVVMAGTSSAAPAAAGTQPPPPPPSQKASIASSAAGGGSPVGSVLRADYTAPPGGDVVVRNNSYPPPPPQSEDMLSHLPSTSGDAPRRSLVIDVVQKKEKEGAAAAAAATAPTTAWSVFQFLDPRDDGKSPQRRLRKYSSDVVIDRSAPMSDLLSMKGGGPPTSTGSTALPSGEEKASSGSGSGESGSCELESTSYRYKTIPPYPLSTDPVDQRVAHQSKLMAKVHRQNIIDKLQRSTQVRGQRLRLLALTPILRSRIRKFVDKGSRVGDGQGGGSSDFCSSQETTRLLESIEVFVSKEEARYIITEALLTECSRARELINPLHSITEPSVQLGCVILYLANLLIS